MHLSALHVYPVKGLRGCSVAAGDIDDLGLVGDRRFMVVDETGRFLSQRTLPRMALVQTQLTPDELILSAPGGGAWRVLRRGATDTQPRTISIWKSDGLLAEDCGEDTAGWLSNVFGCACRLVRIGGRFLRPILKPAAGPGDRVHFADAVPFLVISEASLADLNDRLVARGAEPVPMDRFRPNLVIAGCPAYAEDEWPRFRIGAIAFRAAGPCGRCPVPTIDQQTAARGVEPIRTLATYRRDPRDPTNVVFGQNVIHETKLGTLRVGDPVTLV